MGSVDPADVARFDRLGEAWWDERGPMGKLHEINPVRLRYLTDLVAARLPTAAGPAGAFGSLSVLDVGCGGGILTEPLARLGAAVTGIDPAPTNIRTAEQHAARSGLDIAYRATTAEALAAEGRRFDLVLAMEVVEHVADRDGFVATVASLVTPGGLAVFSTINRTARSFLLAIVGAEYVLRWLPRGTHRWDQFVTPGELSTSLRAAGLKPCGLTGMTFDPLRRGWRLGEDVAVNYFLAGTRPAAA